MAEEIKNLKIHSRLLPSLIALHKRSSAIYETKEVATNKSNLLQVFILGLKFIGVLDYNSTNKKKYPNFRGILTLVITNVYLLYKLCLQLEKGMTTDMSLIRVCVMARYVSLAYGTTAVYLKSNTIIMFLGNLTGNGHSGIERFRSSTLSNIFLFSLALARFMYVLASIEVIAYPNVDELASTWGMCLKWHPALTIFMSFCDVFFYVICTLLQFCLQGLVISAVSVLLARLTKLRSQIEQNKNKIDNISSRHTKLYEIVEESAQVFSGHLLVWLLEGMLVFTALCPVLFKQWLLYGICFCVSSLEAAIVIFGLLGLLLTLSSVSDTNTRLVSACQIRSLSTMNASTKNQITGAFLWSKINSAFINFNIFKCYKIDKCLISILLIASFSYILFALALMVKYDQPNAAVNINATDVYLYNYPI